MSEQEHDQQRLNAAVQSLGEHFESVLVLVTRDFGSKSTVYANQESGNTFASYGAAKQYVAGFEKNMVNRESDRDVCIFDKPLPGKSSSSEAGTQLREEINRIIKRYGQESDVTVYEAIGALEIVKQDLLDHIQ